MFACCIVSVNIYNYFGQLFIIVRKQFQIQCKNSFYSVNTSYFCMLFNCIIRVIICPVSAVNQSILICDSTNNMHSLALIAALTRQDTSVCRKKVFLYFTFFN